MPARSKPPAKPRKPTLRERTPLAEWCAAGLGLVLTVLVVGYSALEAVRGGEDPPALQAQVREVHRQDTHHVVEFEVRNLSAATAADVVTTATLETSAGQVETHSVTLDYVPGRGAARGGMVFQSNPTDGRLAIAAEAYTDP